MLSKVNVRSFKKSFVGIIIMCIMISCFSVNAFASTTKYGSDIDPTQQTSVQLFSDVPTTYWAFSAITNLVNNGVMDGYPDGKFRPTKTMTRAEFAVMLSNVSGLNTERSNYSSFSDIMIEDWYSPYIETVKDYMTGFRNMDGSIIFKPDIAATREDITVAVVKLKGYNIRNADISMIQTMFEDFESISKTSQKYVAIAIKNGLISGFSDDTFRAQKAIQRDQAAAIIWKAFQNGNDNKVSDDTPPVNTHARIPSDINKTPVSTITPTVTPELTKKYSVETLAYVKSTASIIANSNGDIYFIDDNKIKKLADSKITIVADGNIDFAFVKSIKEVGDELVNNSIFPKGSTFTQSSGLAVSSINVNYDTFTVTSLVYDNSSEKIYTLGFYTSSDYTNCLGLHGVGYTIENTALFDVTNTSKPVASYYFPTYGYGYHPTGDLTCMDNGGVIFSGWDAIYRFNINENTIKKYAEFPSAYTSSTMLNSGYTIISNTNKSLTISTYDLSSAKFTDKVLPLKDITEYITSLTPYKGVFYFFAGKKLYTVGQNGTIVKVIDNNDIVIKDSTPIGMIGNFTLDNHGNIIFYDITNKSIRRINV